MKKRRFLSAFLAVVMVILLVPTEIFEVEASEKKDLTQLQADFPDGKYWNHYVSEESDAADYQKTHGLSDFANSVTSYPCSYHGYGWGYDDYIGHYDCNYFYGMQCSGFAQKLAYDAYHETIWGWSKHSSISAVKPGDVVNWGGSTSGHWVFVTSVSGSTVTVGECNVGGLCKIRWGHSYDLSTKSSIVIYSAPYAISGGSTPSYGETTATLSINRTQISPNENIIFSFGGNNNGVIDMAIFKNDSLIESISGIRESTLTKVFTETGSYKAFVTGYSNNGGIGDSNYVYWEVRDLTATLSIERRNYSPNETVTFTFGGYNNSTYDDGVVDMAIIKDDSLYESISGIRESTLAKTFTETGSYKAFITAYSNASGFAESNYVYWEVKPLSATVSVDRSNFSPNETITFTFGGHNILTYGDGGITMAIYKDGSLFERLDIYEQTYTKTFMETGSYKAYITGYSYSGGLADSEYVYWEVKPLSATVSVDRATYSPNEEVVITFGGNNDLVYADGAITIAIYKDNELYERKNIYETTYIKNFAETGSYKAYITGYSKTGEYVDSEYVYWSVTSSILPGDVNGDGSINASDMSYLKRIMKGADLAINGCADVNNDGAINNLDMAMLKRIIKGA